MAATRPTVLVYQQFATLSSTPANPELGCLITGPAVQILDYPDDRSTIKVTSFGTPNKAAVYVPPSAATTYTTLPAMRAGATLNGTSVNAYLENVVVQIITDASSTISFVGATALVAGLTGSTAPSLTISGGNFITLGVRPYDTVVLTDSGSHTITRTVTVVTATVLSFLNIIPLSTETFAADGLTHWYVQRAGVNQQVPSSKVTVTGNQVAIGGSLINQVPTLGDTTLNATTTNPILSADVYVAFTALRTDLATIQTISNPALIASMFGKIDARNPLAVGLSVALANTTTPVFAYGITTNNITGYQNMYRAISSYGGIYAIVPLTSDSSTLLFLSRAVTTAVDPSQAVALGVPQRFRVVIGSIGTLPTYSVLNGPSTTGAVSSHVLSDSAGTFISAGVAVGDFVQTSTVGDYSDAVSFPISVITSNQGITITGDALSGSINYRIARALTPDTQVTALAAIVAAFASQRMISCWPDSVSVSGLVDGSLGRIVAVTPALANPQPGFYLAAAVGGLTASLPSHQGFTNQSIAGISTLYHADTYFSESQLSAISNGGWFVFSQTVATALPKIIHQLTTNVSAIEMSEFSMVKNFDYVSLYFSDILSPFIGTWNINTETMGFIESAVRNGINALKLASYSKIGARINSANISSLAKSSVSRDRLELFIEANFPSPLNTVGLHIVSL